MLPFPSLRLHRVCIKTGWDPDWLPFSSSIFIAPPLAANSAFGIPPCLVLPLSYFSFFPLHALEAVSVRTCAAVK